MRNPANTFGQKLVLYLEVLLHNTNNSVRLIVQLKEIFSEIIIEPNNPCPHLLFRDFMIIP